MAKVSMGLGDLDNNPYLCLPRKFQWLFEIEKVTNDPEKGAFVANLLPPKKGAKPSITFKEMEAEHLAETVSFPGKAEWKPITLSLWDYKTYRHPVFEWIKTMYRPDDKKDHWNPSLDENNDGLRFKRHAYIYQLNGCGDIMEKWMLENAYPQQADFGELDMRENDVVTVDITLKYDRAYIIYS